MPCVHHRDIQTAPLKHSYAVAKGLCSNRQHCRIMADEDDPPGRRQSGLDETDNVGDGQAAEQRPHGKLRIVRRALGISIAMHTFWKPVGDEGNW